VPRITAELQLHGADTDSQESQSQSEIAALKVPFNAVLQKPDPSVDGFQLPVSPSMSKASKLSAANGESQTTSTVKKRSSFFSKVGKVLIGDGAPIWGSDLWY